MTANLGSYRQLLSTIFGNASMAFWMIAQIPQLYKNYRRGSANALSKVFLSIWLLGDVTNLFGSILTHQQPFQIRLATYFVSVDVIMLFQYWYLKSKKSCETQPLLHSDSLFNVPIIASAVISPVSAQVLNKLSDNQVIDYQIGMFLSWMCAILYLSSRIPQIILNYKNKSVSGLSLSMFFCAFMGNLTYSASLVLSDAAVEGGTEFWTKSTPFIVGSFGTLCQDMIIYIQSVVYASVRDDVEVRV